MIIIDPDREGCSVWSSRGFQRVKGNVEECCQRIITYVFSDITNADGTLMDKFQWCPVKLDISGLGIAYGDYLSHYGVEYEVIKPMKII